MKKEKHLSYRRFCLAFTSVEVLAIIAIIGLLSAISYPIYRYATSNSDIITYQTNILNNAYRQYLAEGGKDASNLEQALAALNREDGIKIQPHRTLTVGSVTYTLTFNPTTSSFSYTSSENSPTPTPSPTPSWNFIGVA
ncbi:MAG: hypothetical protein NZL93_05190, partial [Chthoniobacterales bacterium]|nr:hypothetical protein [Chthoniobacterales bacterium]